MKILIIGGGVIGKAIAEFLSSKKHTVTVIEKDPDKSQQLSIQLEATVIEGSALSPAVLDDANISDTDLCLSLTGNAELNLVTASLAKGMGAKRVAARVYADIFDGMGEFDFASHFGIDRLLCVEHLTATAMVRKIGEPVIM
ncbi:MAG: NAD-binding protein, partial [Thermoguttaceae bacterium]|nr:NAD-binding protein [Thermoguttaceae bacterium]